MQRYCRFSTSHCGFIFFVAAAIALSGCSVKFVDDYDAKTYEEIIRLGAEVDKFYGTLLERTDGNRKYRDFQEKYVDLESELRSLYIRNKSRPLNSESTKISESILDLWIKYKGRHKEKDTYKTGNAKLDRDRFIRLFISAASAEAAKNLDPDDTDTSKESRQ
jgi:hypothetical protein